MLPRMPWSSSVNYQAAWQSPREFGGWESTADLNWATCSIAILLFSESSCLPIAYCWDLNFSKDNIMGCSLKSKTGSTPTDGIRTLLKDSGNLPWPFHPVETWHDISSLQPRKGPCHPASVAAPSDIHLWNGEEQTSAWKPLGLWYFSYHDLNGPRQMNKGSRGS